MPPKYNKFINEVLHEINANPSLLVDGEFKKVGSGGPLATLFSHAFHPNFKFLLPEGEPPYRKTDYVQGKTPMIFQQEVSRFKIFCRHDLKPAKIQQLFIQMLESIHEKEARILIAIKDQKLTDLYPNITVRLVVEAGFVSLTEDQIKKMEGEVKTPIPLEDTYSDSSGAKSEVKTTTRKVKK